MLGNEVTRIGGREKLIRPSYNITTPSSENKLIVTGHLRWAIRGPRLATNICDASPTVQTIISTPRAKVEAIGRRSLADVP